MNYSVLIQNRKSVRAFTDKKVPTVALEDLKAYYQTAVKRLLPELQTELLNFGLGAREALEGAAGYHQFLVGAPQYLVLLSEVHPLAHINAGYIMEDLILKLTDMDIASCWLTFTRSQDVKKALGIESHLEVVALAAFGFERKSAKRLKLNFNSMSHVDISAKHRYMEPKRSIADLAYLDTWGNGQNLQEYIGFYDDMLWESLYAASLAPSYLNRQAYGFLLRNGSISLISRPDLYNTPIDRDLSLGIVLHHFTEVAQHWAGKLCWQFGDLPLDLPNGHRHIATAALGHCSQYCTTACKF